MNDKVKFKMETIRDNPQLTCSQLAARLNCSKTTVWNTARDNNLRMHPERNRGCGRKMTERIIQTVKPGYFDINAYGKLGTY